MAVSVIQFGQCGNQIGHSFFSTLIKDMEVTKSGVSSSQNQSYVKNGLDQWFFKSNDKDSLKARAVLVDTEKKVIDEIYQKHSSKGTWSYDSQSVSLQSGGAGNNWALGFQKKGPAMLENVLECLRRQAEECDRLSTIINLLSTAGGTGSGVGSYCIENMRDEYPTKTIASAVVLPFEDGEVVTQSYNTVLTLSKIYNVCDGTFLFSNDHLQKMASNLLLLKDVNIMDLNSLIAQKMCAVFQVQTDNNPTCVKISDILCHMVPHPAFKFCSIKSSPHIPNESRRFEGSLRWSILSDHLKRTLKIHPSDLEGPHLDWELRLPTCIPSAKANYHEFHKCVSNLLITKGSLDAQDVNIGSELLDRKLYPSWAPSSFIHYHQSRKFLDLDKFAALVTNNAQCNKALNSTVNKAWKLFTQKAFLHQYTKFGLFEEDFIDTFIKMESIVKNYDGLS